MIPGYATAEGTERYRECFRALCEAGHFRHPEHVPEAGELWLPSLGMGTYLGQTSAAASAAYVEAAKSALRSGVNLLDTAVNYRHQLSERDLGRALSELAAAGEIARDEVVVCTKAGYLSLDAERHEPPQQYFMREYVERGVLDPADIVGGMHCIAPKYLSDQIERSRRNLGLETLDVFYLHNPETQLSEVERPKFLERVKAAFEFLEEAVAEKRIRWYGMATWDGFRVAPQERGFLSLGAFIGMARELAGAEHHFRFVQLPFNLAMVEAFTLQNQGVVRGHSMLEYAKNNGIAVVASASLLQGRVLEQMNDGIRKELGGGDAVAAAIQFARSAPGVATALVGMGRPEHVKKNIAALSRPPISTEQWTALFSG